ncbi:MAG TPA: glucans biosynthesis glucosyltransferase MdoH, partial [Gammaproteobacteria bacterium]|nr:glucans biosynthesis glucosyltransferase MdoH [Gammaproteobacteria bacterium]
GAAALAAYAGREMVLIVSPADVTPLQWVLVALFTVTFGWIALAASSALVGVALGGVRQKARPGAKPTADTALVMPIYNEDPARALAALHAMGASLADLGSSDRFEIFVLSDTTDPDVWVKETAAIQLLRDSLAGKMRVWYRRRHENSGKKAGNLSDFVTSWGGRYEYMIVLDADSIMSADAIATLVCEMEADPRCGILQTTPRLLGGETLLSRLQQFASAVYGPVVARGISAWQGEDGNYWGHNAIIRLEAFAAAAGLPVLPGRKPFGGEILSHDFVEAALVRRAGWSVRMLPSLEGSWEDSPPSLLDLAARDRRWAQGNLQHLRILPAKGLKLTSRVHMLMGVFGYLASPIWLALILVGTVITAQVATAEFEYFSDGPTLFPRWPVFDSERMIALFVLTAVVLVLPKLLGLLWSLGARAMRRHCVPMTLGATVELALSLLYAPLSMLIQTQQLWEILQGRDSGWRTQQRTHQALSWGELCRRHLGHTIAGVSLATLLFFVSVPLLAWMSPTLLGLVFAVPLSALSSNVALARGLRRVGLLNTPEEYAQPRVAQLRDEFERKLRMEVDAVALETLLRDKARRRRHFDAVLAPVSRPRGRPDVHRITVQMKIAEAGSASEVISWLSDAERMVLLSERDVFESLLEPRAGVSPRPFTDNGANVSRLS